MIFPAVERARLANGIEVALARRADVPLTSISVQFDAGSAADHGRKLGTEMFVSHLLDEGTEELDSIELANAEQRLGAEIGVRSNLDSTVIWLRAMNAQLVPSIALFADILRKPAFREEAIERLRQSGFAQISYERTAPALLAERILPTLLYGPGHPYGIPPSGMGTAESFGSITRADILAFHRDHYRPDSATIFVVGDTTLPAITALLEQAFGDWAPPQSPLPRKNLAPVARPDVPRVFLIDRPGAEQSTINGGLLNTPTSAPGYIAMLLANDVFGSGFTSRINMNLREDKHWTYGAYSSLRDAVGQRALIVSAAVQSDKTAEAMREILKEVSAIVSPTPPTDAEIDIARKSRVRSLPGIYEQSDAVLRALETNHTYGRPDAYVANQKQALESQTEADVVAAAKRMLSPDALTWLVVGDLSKIEDSIRALNIGPVTVLDADGKVIR
ncbi:M16 family metallopeptidase [Sphingobium lactosutens]|uniref:M16 family metallopeptidase n=1 Tax=Sphingobium lactosutens TaxID=522773 RepID=UPI0004162502|nr:pitrilysin family protein [Sphingobium lactosutens]